MLKPEGSCQIYMYLRINLVNSHSVTHHFSLHRDKLTKKIQVSLGIQMSKAVDVKEGSGIKATNRG